MSGRTEDTFNVTSVTLVILQIQIWNIPNKKEEFLISNFRRVPNVVCFLLGDSPASEVHMPTFRDTLSVPSSEAGRRL
jgi:hypothetical protein